MVIEYLVYSSNRQSPTTGSLPGIKAILNKHDYFYPKYPAGNQEPAMPSEPLTPTKYLVLGNDIINLVSMRGAAEQTGYHAADIIHTSSQYVHPRSHDDTQQWISQPVLLKCQKDRTDAQSDDQNSNHEHQGADGQFFSYNGSQWRSDHTAD